MSDDVRGKGITEAENEVAEEWLVLDGDTYSEN